MESGVTAKESSVKKSIKKKADAKEVAKVAVNVDSIESDPFHSALMKKINAADLKQKVSQTINQSMRRINAKHMMFMFQDLSKTKKWKESLDCCSWQ